MPENFAVGCPAGDRDKIVITIALDALDVPLPLDASDIRISQPKNPATVFFRTDTVIHADETPVLRDPDWDFWNGYYEAKVTISTFGGCGVDSVLISLYGMPLGYAYLNLRSFDANASGEVQIIDFASYSAHHNSSRCNCVPIYPQPYSPCFDYALPDTVIMTVDFGLFGGHYHHVVPGQGGNAPSLSTEASAGNVRLEFEESHPLIGQHKLRVKLMLEGVEPFVAGVLALRNENPKLVFVGWAESAGYDGETMCADVVRDGQGEVFIGILPHQATFGSVTVGTAEFLVISEQTVTLTDDDFALVTADVFSAGGRTLAMSGLSAERVMLPVAYESALAQNYPNPFNPLTTIAFSLARDENVDLSIYDVRGSLVRELVDGRRERGIHRIVWDGVNSSGLQVASGVYFYKLVAGSFTDTKKMTILK
jgi:hypothetical protein